MKPFKCLIKRKVIAISNDYNMSNEALLLFSQMVRKLGQ